MNQINKILSGLKKRKASAPTGDAPAESARLPAIRSKLLQNKVVLIAALAFVMLSVAGGLWFWLGRTPVPLVKTAKAPSRPISAPKPVAPPAAAQAEAVKEEMAQAEVASQPVAEVAQKQAPGKAEAGKPEAAMDGASQEGEAHKKVARKAKPQEVASKEKTPAESESVPVPEKKAAPEKKETVKNNEQDSSPPPAVASKDEEEAATQEQPTSSPEPEMADMSPEPEVMASTSGVDKQVKPLSPEEQANNEFIKASGLAQRGEIKAALAGYETVLHLDPGHEAARQAMVVLLLHGKRSAEAERVLQEGLEQNIKNSGFAMLLARIQLDRDAPWSALLTLQKTLPYATQQADYQAFIAALLQRLDKHKEAVVHYRMAVELAPDSGVWWMGMGISLKALRQTEDARTAFKRALQSNALNAELRDFVNRQLRDL